MPAEQQFQQSSPHPNTSSEKSGAMQSFYQINIKKFDPEPERLEFTNGIKIDGYHAIFIDELFRRGEGVPITKKEIEHVLFHRHPDQYQKSAWAGAILRSLPYLEILDLQLVIENVPKAKKRLQPKKYFVWKKRRIEKYENETKPIDLAIWYLLILDVK